MDNQEAINILGQYDVSNIHFYTTDGKEIPFAEWSDAIEMAISALRSQDLQLTCNQLATDTISRRATIDAVLKESNTDGAYGYMDTKSIVDLLNEQPPAQPDYTAIKYEIQRNIDDFYNSKHHAQHVSSNGRMIAFGLELALDIVKDAERRTDGDGRD